jgi:signal transduction histidine kinase
MSTSSNFAVKLRDWLLRWRWWIAAAAAMLVIVVELGEHGTASLRYPDSAFLREFLLFGVVGPLLIGGILTVLRRAQSERTTAVAQVSLQRLLGEQLARIQDWDELADFIVNYPRSLVAVIGVSLYVFDPFHKGYELAAEWWAPGLEPAPTPTPSRTSSFCGTCVVSHATAMGHPLPLRCVDNVRLPHWGNRYCLPLMRGSLPIAFLYLYFPADVLLSVQEVNLLGGLAPAIAVAVNDARPQRSAAIQAEAAETERQRIARDLHDTLGQSLAYLHLKLDQLTGEDAEEEIGAIRQELERMRDVANESYQKVRTTLDDLRAVPSPDLAGELLDLARSVGRQAGLETRLESSGRPRPLPLQVQRHILYVFREALANVQKHAGARHVDLEVVWEDDALTVRLRDDGRGFSPDYVPADGHYGLAIMRERAREIDGGLEVTSAPGGGTEVSLTLSYLPAAPAAKGERE